MLSDHLFPVRFKIQTLVCLALEVVFRLSSFPLPTNIRGPQGLSTMYHLVLPSINKVP